MKLEGLLVDLVPYDERFKKMDHQWLNSKATYFLSMGEQWFATQAGIERHYQEHAERLEREGSTTHVSFGVQTKDGTPLGFFSINWIAYPHRLANLGAMIGEPDYWGGGYGTDALLLLLDYAFAWLDMHKIWLMTMGTNARVKRQMEKVGFLLEAQPRQGTFADGEWLDALVYGLLRSGWPGREAVVETLGLRAK
ncbi:MAG: GNAT family N-acetyltransferase [Chloroflexi bacterium]|nr:GNAT family N-acetyltransferase [Chloroflexota bacterium]